MLEGHPLDSILISRLRYLGDVVMATPLLEVLRRGAPAIKLGFLAEKNHGLVLQGHDCVDRLHLLDTQRKGADARARSGQDVNTFLPSLPPGEMVSDLRSCSYDLAVDLFFNPRSAWLLRLAGIRHRISGTKGIRRLLYSHNIVPNQSPEKFDRLFQLASGGLGEHLARLAPLVHVESGLSFLDWIQKEYASQVLKPVLPQQFWAQKDAGNIPIADEALADQPIILAPGATWPVKEWPLAHWGKLIDGLVAQSGKSVFVIQPPGNKIQWSELASHIPAGRGGLLPVLNLSQVLSVISQACLLISVDGGVMHAGVGLGVPVVALFGPTDPALWFPYTNAGPFHVLKSQATCAPCNLHECDNFICLPEVQPGVVLSRCLGLLLKQR